MERDRDYHRCRRRLTSVFAADIDGDGDLDVLSTSGRSDDTVALYRNGDGVSGGGDGSAWTKIAITTGADFAQSVFAADLDGDGDLDVLSASAGDDTIALYRNGDGVSGGGDGTSWTETEITTGADGARSVFAADLDGDGDLDVLSASQNDDTIAWYANVRDPLTLASTTPARNALDVAAGAAVTLTFGRAVDAATVTPQTLVVTGSQSGPAVGTFAGGGTATLAFAPSAPFLPGETVTVTATRGLAAQDNGGRLAAAQTLTYTVAAADAPAAVWSPGVDLITSAEGANDVYAADVDGDGDLDALSASFFDNTIAFYRNGDGVSGDGDGTAWTKTAITTSADGAESVYAADVDGDGDLDALSASFGDDTVAFYRNGDGVSGDGDGTTWTKIAITATADGAASVVAADIDGDGDLDVLSASVIDDTIALYRNGDRGSGDGDGTTWSRTVITTTANGAESVYAADVDADGDLDVLSASFGDDTIAFYRNGDGVSGDGDGTTWTKIAITTTANGARSVYAADVDGDGDLDALSASFGDDTVAFYRNGDGVSGDGDGTAWTKIAITAAADGATGVYAADVDGDGDLDALSASSSNDTVAFYRNGDGVSGDGDGTAWTEIAITTTADGAESVVAADIDGDGDLDALSASFSDDTIAWYESTPIAPVVYVDPGATGGDGSQATPFGSLQDAIDATAGGQTITIAGSGTFNESVSVPAGKNLTLELPSGEVQVTGDLTTASALTVTGAGPLAVTGAFGTTGSGTVTGTVPLVAGPYVPGTAASDTGFRTLAFSADATAADVLAAAPQRPDFTTRLFTFDALAEGSGGSQGAFVPVTSPSTPLPVGTGIWLYVYDDGTFEDLGPGDALFLRQSAPYDASQAPGAGFGAQDVSVTLAPGTTDCMSPPFGLGSEIFFYLGNPYADASPSRAWAWAVRASRRRPRCGMAPRTST